MLTKEDIAINYYADYLNIIKPLIAEIESRTEKFPTPILNEIRAFNDHMAYYYASGNYEDQDKQDRNLYNAESHIRRIKLDCFKILNVSFLEHQDKFEKDTKHIDLTAISNGLFFQKYNKLKREAIFNVKQAKIKEGLDTEESLGFYNEAYKYFHKLEDYIDANMSYINRARTMFYINKTLLALWSVLVFILGTIIDAHYPEIEKFIINHL